MNASSHSGSFLLLSNLYFDEALLVAVATAAVAADGVVPFAFAFIVAFATVVVSLVAATADVATTVIDAAADGAVAQQEQLLLLVLL